MATNKPENAAVHPARRLLAHMTLYGCAEGFSGLIRLALAALYSRLLQPAEFGILAIVQVSVLFAYAIGPLGLPEVLMIRFGKGGAGVMKGEMDRAYTLLTYSSGILGVVVLFSAFLVPLPAQYRRLVPWAVLWSTALTLWFVPGQALRFRGKVAEYAVARVLQTVLMAAILCVLVRVRSAGLEEIIVSEALGAVLGLGGAHVLAGYCPRIGSVGNMGELIRAGAPFWLLAIATVAFDYADRYVISIMVGVEATGYYAIAGRIAIVGNLLTTAFHAIWQPYAYGMLAAQRTDRETLRTVARKLALAFTAMLVLCMELLPRLMTVRIAGRWFIAPAYHGATILVAPLLLQYVFKTFYLMSTPAINFHNRTWRQLAMTVVVGAVAIATNGILLRILPGHACAKMIVTACVSAGAYAVAMVFGIHEFESLHRGVSLGYGFALAAIAAVVLPLVGMNGTGTAAAGVWILALWIILFRRAGKC